MEIDEIIEKTDLGIKDIVELYFKMIKGNSRIVKKWYKIGELIEIEVKQRLEKDKRFRNKDKMKYEVIKDITYEIEKGEKVVIETIKNRLRNALKVYDLFEEIGTEKIGRISNRTKVNTVTKMTSKEVEYVKSHFKKDNSNALVNNGNNV